MYDFTPFFNVVGEMGKSFVPLAIPALCTWLVLSWIADLLLRN